MVMSLKLEQTNMPRIMVFSQIKNYLTSAFGFLLLVYFAYHALSGERGLLNWLRLQQELTTAKITLSKLKAENTALEKNIALIKSEHIHPDLLEERVRIMLNYARPEESIYYLPE